VSPARVEWAFPPLAGSYKVDQSSFVKLLRFTPSISTKSEVVPFVSVIVQGGPGATQPEGVRPGVSHRLESPPKTGGVVPGENRLALNDAEPVLFAVMSVTLTTKGVHGTFVFQENGVIVAETEASSDPEGMDASVERNRIAMPRGRVTAILFKRILQCLTVFFAIPQTSSSPPVRAESSAFRSLLVRPTLLGLSTFSNISIASGPAESLHDTGPERWY